MANLFDKRARRGALLGAVIALSLPASALGTEIEGTVEVADGPVKGSTVELFAAGSAAIPLDQASSDRKGEFLLSYDPSGIAGSTPLYAIASRGSVRGEQVGRPLRLMTVAGTVAEPITTLVVGERSTVASGYALARFIDGKQVTGPEPGLPNAAGNFVNLVEASTAKVSFVLANFPNGTATESLPTFNTLANALASCTGGEGCGELLDAAKPEGEPRPRDTLAAVVDIAHNPARRTNRLFGLQGSPPPFKPALGKPPTAWTIALLWLGGGMDAPGRMAFDAHGRIWTNNNFQPQGTSAGQNLTVLSPDGEPTLGSPITGGGLSGAGWGMAIGPDGAAWVANFHGASLSVFTPDGRAVSPDEGFTNEVGTKPQGLAIAPDGTVWVANFGSDSVSRYPGGQIAAGGQVTGAGISNPFSVQVDADGNAWVTNGAESVKPGSVTKISPDGTPAAGFPISGAGLRSPQGLAIDSRGDVWVANLFSESVTRIHGTAAKRFSPASLGGNWGIAVDGADQVWVAGFLEPNVTQLCGNREQTCPEGTKTGEPISPAKSGYANAAQQHTTAIEVDQAGSVWTANNWSDGSPLGEFVGGNGLLQWIGIAEPVKAPLLGPPQRP